MTGTKIVKTEKVTPEEIREVTEMYKRCNSQNRNLMLLTTNLLLASQENNDSDKKAG